MTLGGGKSIEYSYDAAGNKIQELEIDNSTTIRTDYIGNFIYKKDSVQHALTQNGRTVFSKEGEPKEELFVKDHLGNVRSVVDVYTYTAQEYLATYEIASAGIEGVFFDNHNEIRSQNPTVSPDNGHAGRLNGGEPGRETGTIMLLKVMAGDKIELNVNSYYDGYNPGNDRPLDAETIAASLYTVLSTGTGGFEGSESHNADLVNTIFSGVDPGDLSDLLLAGADAGKPKAFLNYVMFDAAMKLVPGSTKSFQATGNGSWAAIGTPQPVEITEDGYLLLFLNNTTADAGCASCYRHSDSSEYPAAAVHKHIDHKRP